jgi:hypothetical protein
MQMKRVHRVVLGTLAAALVLLPLVALLPGNVNGSEDQMLGLPAYAKFKCVICHTIANPTVATAPLNLFGQDYLANGGVWNEELATENSDGDRCSNGFELGDQDGDGVFDEQGTPLEHSNPGDPDDCSIALTETTWGIIKDIFSNEMEQFTDDGLDYDFSTHFP